MYISDKAQLEKIYKEGAEKAEYLARRTLSKVMKKIGFDNDKYLRFLHGQLREW